MEELLAPVPEPGSSSPDGRRERGIRTRRAILGEAVQIASEEGLEGLSIGRLAGALGVSKSGLFAHFGSKTELQLATVDAARTIFIDEVTGRGRAGSGIGGVIDLADTWLNYMEREVFRGGCFFAAVSIEFDSRLGPVRDRIASMMGEWLLALEAAIQDAQDAGELPPELDSEQIAFEINSIGLGANWAFQLYRDDAAFDRARRAIRERLSDPASTSVAASGRGGELLPLETEVDGAAARRSLRAQIAKLERDLAALFASNPERAIEWQVSAPGGPRVLDVGDLEELRDQLAVRVEDTRGALRDRAKVSYENREHMEALIRDPASFKWQRISNDDIGEPGCKYFHSRPRLGLIGMLMGWWQVKISSGCP